MLSSRLTRWDSDTLPRKSKKEEDDEYETLDIKQDGSVTPQSRNERGKLRRSSSVPTFMFRMSSLSDRQQLLEQERDSPKVLTRVFLEIDDLRRIIPKNIKVILNDTERTEIDLPSLDNVSFGADLSFYAHPPYLKDIKGDDLVRIVSKYPVFLTIFHSAQSIPVECRNISMEVPASVLTLIRKGSVITLTDFIFSSVNNNLRTLIKNPREIKTICEWSEYFTNYGYAMYEDGNLFYKTTEDVPFLVKLEDKVDIEMIAKYPVHLKFELEVLAFVCEDIFQTGVWGYPGNLDLEKGIAILGPFKCDSEIPENMKDYHESVKLGLQYIGAVGVILGGAAAALSLAYKGGKLAYKGGKVGVKGIKKLNKIRKDTKEARKDLGGAVKMAAEGGKKLKDVAKTRREKKRAKKAAKKAAAAAAEAESSDEEETTSGE